MTTIEPSPFAAPGTPPDQPDYITPDMPASGPQGRSAEFNKLSSMLLGTQQRVVNNETTLGGALLGANNLSDLTSAGTARSNLGLGTAAQQPATAFDAAGAAAAAAAASLPLAGGTMTGPIVGMLDKGGEWSNVKAWGAKGDLLSGSAGSVAASSTAFTDPNADFTLLDVGKTISITGAGTSGAKLTTTIAAYVSTTAVTLATPAVTGVASVAYLYGTDDSTAIQNCINAVRATTLPGASVFFPWGNYLVTKSLDFTNIMSLGEGVSINVRGTSLGSARIYALLSEAYPVMDFTGSGRPRVDDIWVTGDASGLQTCAYLFARGSNGAGDKPYGRIKADGTYSIVAMAVVSADLGNIYVELNGGNQASVMVGATALLGVTSKFQTFDSVNNLSLFTFQPGSTFQAPSSGEAILWGEGDSLCVDNCYVNLPSTAGPGYAISLNVDTTGKRLFARNLRVESNGATQDTYVLNVPAGTACNGGELSGSWALYAADANAGVVLLTATSPLNNMRMWGAVSFTGSGTPHFFAGANTFYSCDINNESGLGYNTALTGSPYSNIIRHTGATTPWAISNAGDLAANIQMSSAAQGFIFGTPFVPALDFLYRSAAGARMTSGTGAPTLPANANPTAGDVYFRTDTPSTANQRIYVCTVGGSTPTWVGII